MEIYVSIEDVTDCIHCQGTPKYRIVKVELTKDQKRKLNLRKHESFSTAYIQTDEDK